MKIIIFCGGKGTRINKSLKKKILKPLLIVKKKPLLKYIMEVYSKHNFNHFILLGGYKIKELLKFKDKYSGKLKIDVINTGLNTNTGGRLLKIKDLIKNEPFFLTYGDSLIDYNPNNALKKWNRSKDLSISAYSYMFPYGQLDVINNGKLKNFNEKKEFLINAGYYLLDKRIFQYIKGDESFEKKTLPRILKSKKINFKIKKTYNWFPIDTIEDKNKLKESLDET